VVAVAASKAGPANGAWDDRKAADAAATVPDAVVVFVRPKDAAGGRSLATALPGQLRKDLRVTANGWVLVGVGDEMRPALDVLSAPHNPYTSVALVCDGASGPAKPVLDGIGRLPKGLSALLVSPIDLDATTMVTVAMPPDARFAAALLWAQNRLPPTLAPPVVEAPVPAKPTPSRSPSPAARIGR
jgi:hypothetical protein